MKSGRILAHRRLNISSSLRTQPILVVCSFWYPQIARHQAKMAKTADLIMLPESQELQIKMGSILMELSQIVGPCSKDLCAQKRNPNLPGQLAQIVKRHFSQSSTLRRQFSRLTSVSERLSHFLDDVHLRNQLNDSFEQCKMILMPCTCHKIDARKADGIRLVGNKVYSENLYLVAFRFYTIGLMWAPELSDEAALLYGNRSAAFYHIDQHENALEDIERAFKLDYARLKPTGTGKLLIRKAECLLKLGRVDEAKEMFQSQEQPLKYERWKELKVLAQNTKVEKRDVNLFKFQETSAAIKVLTAKGKFTPNDSFSWLNGKVELRYNAENGFQLFAKEDLAYGEVAAIGEPFVSWAMYTLFPRPQVIHQCHYCLTDMGQADGYALPSNPGWDLEKIYKLQGISSGPSRSFAPVPCTVCPNVLFCSEVCRRQAWDSFHQFECSQVLTLHSFNHQARLALRMLYSAGSLERIKQVAKDWDDKADRFEMMKNPRDYAFIYGMRQDEKCAPEELFRLMSTAVILAKLAQFSGFVGDAREDELFTIRILLRYLLQLKANVTMPAEGNHFEAPTRLHGIATLMGKSSRKANIARFWVAQTAAIQSNTHLFYATRTIKAGEELRIFAGNNHQMFEAEVDLQFDVLLTSPDN